MNCVVNTQGEELGFQDAGDWPIPSGQVAALSCNGEFYVRASSGGDLLDPLDGDRLGQKDRERTGALRFELKKCGPNCYSSFVRFLRSKQRAHLVAAQREFLNESR